MVRRKQNLPARANGIFAHCAGAVQLPTDVPGRYTQEALSNADGRNGEASMYNGGIVGIKVYPPTILCDDVDIAEINIINAVHGSWLSHSTQEVKIEDIKENLKVRMHLLRPRRDCGVSQFSVSADDVNVEVLEQAEKPLSCESPLKEEAAKIVCFGHLDGSNESISALVYLFKAGYVTVKPHLDFVGIVPTCRLRIGIPEKSFGCSDGLLGSIKHLWSKNMLKLIKWLRPDLHTSETIYGKPECVCPFNLDGGSFAEEEVEDEGRAAGGQQGSLFNPSDLYEAIKPNQSEPLSDAHVSGLLATLRPYQRRAVHWMVTREKKTHSSPVKLFSGISGDGFTKVSGSRDVKWPFCNEVKFLDQKAKLYYNPFSGRFAKDPFEAFPDVRGGILADEMGLGKTVELLACIMANPYINLSPQGNNPAEKAAKELQEKLTKRKAERIDCTCDANEEESYSGIWVQCDLCDVWQHAACVGFGLEYQDKEHFVHGNGAEELNSQKKKRKTMGKNISAKAKRWTVNESFICGMCARIIGSVEVDDICGATLIVCPSSILEQWKEEIRRHTQVGALNVLVYEGFQKGGSTLEAAETIKNFQYGMVVGAHELARADIVLTTYDTLQADLLHDAEGNGWDERSMRFVKRYPVVPTPLTRLHWWRVCLDEAQMVECNSSRATEMARRLKAEIRWCITGTPIQRGLDDLHGLFRFLDLQPFNDPFWWTKVITEPYMKKIPGAIEFTHRYLKHFMWRSSKVQVNHDLGLPPQEQLLTWLNFSPIEAHFYRQQHERCARKAMEIMRESRQLMESQHLQFSQDRVLTHAEAANMVHPLLSLRQACCHPQVGSSGLRSLQRSPLTMDEVLKVLLEKAKTEGEEAQRSLIGSLNGLAALAILEHRLQNAATIYREALSLTEENAESFDVDPLQKLHVLHNLDEVLKTLNMEDTAIGSVQQNLMKCNTGEFLDVFDTLHPSKQYKLKDGEKKRASHVVDYSQIKNTVLDMQFPGTPMCSGPKPSRDELLKQQAQDIRTKYMGTFYAKLAASRHDYKLAKHQVNTCLQVLDETGGTVWWLHALASIHDGSKQGKDLLRKIKDTLLQTGGHDNASSLALRFSDLNGLKYIINRELDAIACNREKLVQRINEVDDLLDNPSSKDVDQAVNCSICDHNQKGPACYHCEIDKLFQLYENRLFLIKSSAANVGEVVSLEDAYAAQQRMLNRKRFDVIKTAAGSCGFQDNRVGRSMRERNQAAEIVQVSRAPSETENILKMIKASMRQKMGQDFLDAGMKHLEALEAMRKEYAQARMLAVSHRIVLLALDELNMAITRLQLRAPGEKASNATDELFKLELEELFDRNAQLTGDKFAALEELRRAKGQFRYLKGLDLTRKRALKQDEKSFPSSRSDGGETSLQRDATDLSDRNLAVLGLSEFDNCPVCHEVLGTQMMILPCGHMLCCKCTLTIVEHTPNPVSQPELKRIMCPSCRYRTNIENIALINNASEATPYSQTLSKFYSKEEVSESHILVQGAYGAKMEAVTRRILRVKNLDAKAKILIFSTWNDVLDVVEHTLAANQISFIRGKGRRNLSVAIQKFKSKGPDSAQVLLLLMKQGANGLNLVEAQHVILIEPLLNPGAEAQAVNRVHRIGQSNATFVHKFLIKDTVEESIFKLSQLKQTGSSSRRSKNNQEVSTLTLNELEMLFKTEANDSSPEASKADMPTVSLRDLPPSVAAATAAEARQRQQAAR